MGAVMNSELRLGSLSLPASTHRYHRYDLVGGSSRDVPPGQAGPARVSRIDRDDRQALAGPSIRPPGGRPPRAGRRVEAGEAPISATFAGSSEFEK